jgi:uncharacterized membrane protein HdeD (DUF308 family)
VNEPVRDLKMFWWAFAVRGGLAIIFAMVLFLSSAFLGIFFFDPVTLVYLSLLLGSFVLGNGLLQGIAAGYGFEHHLHVSWVMLCECFFAVLLGIYIGISLVMTRESLAFLGGLHAVGAGGFQAMLAVKLRDNQFNALLLGAACLFSLAVGFLFLTHVHQAARATTQALSGFELVVGMTWIVLSLRLRR